MSPYLLLAPVAVGVGALAATEPVAGDPSMLAPYISGGGAAAAVSGLLYVLKKLLDGSLIPRQVRDVEAELSAAIVAAGQREAAMMKVVEDSNSLMRDVRDELRAIRRAVDQGITDVERAVRER